ncbi:MAG TPA: putative metallopeptidase [Candidatus Acidoferrum sp.]|jgi:predicted metallopeptidase|nr:putative metallopeptidase [Candidatus Acidoferrum sp.]
MPIQYSDAPDVKKLADEVTECLDFNHVVPQFVFCFRSKGSSSDRTIARIHGLGKIWQEALNLPPSYVIEVISERYDKLSEADREKTIIHELLHIPHSFAGGFRPHKGYIDRKTVEQLYITLQKQRATRRQGASGLT